MALQKCHSFLAMFPSKYSFKSRGGSPILSYNLFTSIQVLDLLQLYLPTFPSFYYGENLSQLRYLALNIGALPGSFPILSCLKNLQTLILQSAIPYVVYLTLPKTPQLRHIRILGGSSFHFKDEEDNLILENLTTLLWLSDFCCKNEALMVRIPNVKKLGVRYEIPKCSDSKHPIDLLHTLSHLEQLQSIRFYGYDSLKKAGLAYNFSKSYGFPPKLKKLNFFKTWMKLEIMTILGRLPNLQVLQLEKDAFDVSEIEWEQVEKGFPKLKVLVFKSQSLCRWIDCYFSFPILECLVIKSCHSLESLPYECLTGCPCLKLIDLEGCNGDVLESAKEIQNDGDGVLEVRYKEKVVRSYGVHNGIEIIARKQENLSDLSMNHRGDTIQQQFCLWSKAPSFEGLEYQPDQMALPQVYCSALVQETLALGSDGSMPARTLNLSFQCRKTGDDENHHPLASNFLP
nr:putative late blight resistance protein homolog R1A-3 [Ipomoea trifida]